MDKKQLLALIATFDATEKATFAKAFGLSVADGGAENTGLTQADLDAALEPFTKGGFTVQHTDTSKLDDMAQLDVTGFLGEMKKGLDGHFGANAKALDTIAKGFTALLTKFDSLEKSLTAPMGSGAVLSASQLSMMNKGGFDNAGGRVIDPNAAAKYENISADRLLEVMRKGFESASDPARKEQIMQVMIDYESGADFDPSVIDALNLTF